MKYRDVVMITDYWGITEKYEFFMMPLDEVTSGRYPEPVQMPQIPPDLSDSYEGKEKKIYQKRYLKEQIDASWRRENWYKQELTADYKKEYKEWLDRLKSSMTGEESKAESRRLRKVAFDRFVFEFLLGIFLGILEMFTYVLAMVLEDESIIETNRGFQSETEEERNEHFQKADNIDNMMKDMEEFHRETDGEGNEAVGKLAQENNDYRPTYRVIKKESGTKMCYDLTFGQPNVFGLQAWPIPCETPYVRRVS